MAQPHIGLLAVDLGGPIPFMRIRHDVLMIRMRSINPTYRMGMI